MNTECINVKFFCLNSGSLSDDVWTQSLIKIKSLVRAHRFLSNNSDLRYCLSRKETLTAKTVLVKVKVRVSV